MSSSRTAGCGRRPHGPGGREAGPGGQAARGGDPVPDGREPARAYLDATVGERVPAARKEAYLDQAPRMVKEFHDRTDVRFVYTDGYSDYCPERPGGFACARTAPRSRACTRRGTWPRP
ncbi:hypothetical protein OOK13_21550 [Streptomyces sp. NBC_00378]|uniref:hypothetical protein n=1 Tax=unclassified Streptomyces TaxID=2593676 RepID=UPI0022539CE0|nr:MULTISPECIES: hypothetical protein [unclassified Streptomyces]MCX5111084.1 hypothetical protein [Streptomyces sp. NBC_00378]